MFIERFLERGIGEFHAADVRDVFALSQFAVQVQSGQRLVLIILIDDRLRAFFKFFR